MKLSARAKPRVDGALSIVEADEDRVVLSNGHEMLLASKGLAEVCRQLCQDSEAVFVVRSWPVKDGERLIAIRRRGVRPSLVTLPTEGTVF